MSNYDDDNGGGGGGGNGADGGDGEDGFVIRVRGLPWSATTEEIASFFGECEIKGGQEGIHMTMTREGRPSGEAYIEMESDEDCEKAVKKDGTVIVCWHLEKFPYEFTSQADLMCLTWMAEYEWEKMERYRKRKIDWSWARTRSAARCFLS